MLLAFYGCLRPHLAWTPEIRPGPDRFRSLEECGRHYLRQARQRLIVRLMTVSLFAISLFEAFSASPDLRRDYRADVFLFCGTALAVLISLAIGVLLRAKRDRDLIAANPQLQGCFTPMIQRWFGVIVIALLTFFGGVALWMAFAGMLEAGIPFLGLLVIASSAQRFAIAVTVKGQVPVPDDSELAHAINSTLEKCGFNPKRVVLIPSTVANAIVAIDGSTFLTTALVNLFSIEEVSGVIAHEVCHAINKDPKRLEKRRRLAGLALGLLMGCLVAGLGFVSPANPYTLTTCLLGAATLWPISTYITGTLSRKLEFRCDAFAADHGYGAALASCLSGLHRYQGLPLDWTPYDSKILTHPSLRERLANLGIPDPR